jgi:hypothetical protein
MALSTGAGAMTGKPLIESDRVEGTTVYDPRGTHPVAAVLWIA